VHDLGIAFHLHVLVGLHRSVLGHPPDVVATEIDEHDVLGALFLVGPELLFELPILVGASPPRPRARDRPHLDDAVGAPHQRLGR